MKPDHLRSDIRIPIMIDMLSEFDQKKMQYNHTLQTVGDTFGITRERVRQIISTVGFSRKSVTLRRLQDAPECKSTGCTERMNWLRRGGYAEQCHKHMFNRETVSLICSWSGCGIQFTRPVYSHRPNYNRGKTGIGKTGVPYFVPETKQKEFFCTKSHQGKWLAETHGFPAHPENRAWEYEKWTKEQRRAKYTKLMNKWLDKIVALDREGEGE